MQVKILASFALLVLLSTIYFIVFNPFLEDFAVIGEKRPLVILHWNKAYDKFLFDNEDMKNCPINNCKVVFQKSQAEEADAILFHGMHPTMKRQYKRLLKLRSSSQATFIFHSREPPSLTLKLGNWSRNFFDATMTYRRDSDIFNALYELAPKGQNGQITAPDFTRKFQMATWLVSKCQTPGRREKIVEKLKDLIDLKVFGKCGLKPLLPRTQSKVETYRGLLQPYFFYLSFENSRCKDYISEKFYNVLFTKAAVPVVFGPSKSDYQSVAPPHSFIHVSDFDNAKLLADYLHFLTQNQTAYSEYFQWTRKFNLRKIQPACQVCAFLHKKQKESQRILDFNQYWVNEGDCDNPITRPWT